MKPTSRLSALIVVIACLVWVSLLQSPARAITPLNLGYSRACQANTEFNCGVLQRLTSDGQPDWTRSPSGLGADDIESAYGILLLTANSGASRTIALVDAYHDTNAEADMTYYRKHYGLPSCTSDTGCFKQLNQNGSPSPLPGKEPANSNWALETSLDLDMISATCPLCSIVLVESNTSSHSDLMKAEAVAAGLHPVAVSNSWGGPENSKEASDDHVFTTAPSTAFVFSAGDNDYGTQYPAASPDVISVGGTVLTKDQSSRGWSESVWGSAKMSQSGTGSGCSKYEPRPSWQQVAVSACPNGRADNDISAVASNVAIYDTARSAVQKLLNPGGWDNVGGTSAAAPLVAGLIGLSGGTVTGPASLYSRSSSAYYDVTSGTNGNCGSSSAATYILCHAESGWDGPTGFGSPASILPFAGALYGSDVLIAGSGDYGDTTPNDALATILKGAGYNVTETSSLPSDLSKYGSLWYVSSAAPSDADVSSMIQFAESGRGLYLTGERPCCEALNQADSTIINSIVHVQGGIGVGGIGDVCDCVQPLAVNTSAAGGAGAHPFSLTTWTPAAPGGMTNVPADNVFTYYADNAGGRTTTGAVWPADQGTGIGPVAILMDINWLEPTYADAATEPEVARNLAFFLSGLSTPPAPAVSPADIAASLRRLAAADAAAHHPGSASH